jgi:hypothetical protein
MRCTIPEHGKMLTRVNIPVKKQNNNSSLGPEFSGRISAEGGGGAAGCSRDGEGGAREQYSITVDHKVNNMSMI